MLRNVFLMLMIIFAAGCGQQEKEVAFQGVVEEKNYIQLGMAQLQQKNVPEAIKNFDQAIKLDPKNPENYMVLGQVYLMLKNYTRAIDTLTAATSVGPMNGKAHYMLAVSLRMRNKDGDMEKAVESVKRSIICFQKAQDQKGLAQAAGLYKALTTGEEGPAEMQVSETDVSGM